jgi:hypothetical protein
MSVHFLRLRPEPGGDRHLLRVLRFLVRLVHAVPRLLAELEHGHVESGQLLGRRRLADGRTAQLWIEVRVVEQR